MASVPDALAGRPFTSAMARAAGVSARQLQSSKYRRVFFGVHAEAHLELSTEVLARGIFLVLPPGGVVAGTTAALLHGADVRRMDETSVDVVVPRDDQVRRAGVRARAALVEETDVVFIHGIPCLSPVRVAFDFARQRRLVDSLVGVDAMLNRGGCDLPELADYVADHPGWRGVRFAREALVQAEPLSESVMETKQRLGLIQAGLPRPRAQVNLFGADGEHVARLDHGYDEWRVGLDYDGEVHRDRWRFQTRDDRDHAQVNRSGPPERLTYA